MSRKTTAAIVVGALVMAVTAWMTFPSEKTKPSGDPSKYRYMHCPKCLRERMYSPADADKPCPYCEKRLVPTEESVTNSANKPGNPYGRMFVFLYVELLAVMGAVWYLSRPRSATDDEDFLYINCEKCRQKIRYREQQVGLAAMCRRCGQSFVYPEEGPGD